MIYHTTSRIIELYSLYPDIEHPCMMWVHQGSHNEMWTNEFVGTWIVDIEHLPFEEHLAELYNEIYDWTIYDI